MREVRRNQTQTLRRNERFSVEDLAISVPSTVLQVLIKVQLNL